MPNSCELSRRSDGIYSVDLHPAFLIGVAGCEANDTDYTVPKHDIRNSEKRILSHALDIPRDKIFFLDQEHGDSVVVISAPTDPDQYVCAAADAMITDQTGLCLVIRTADCVPVILFDPVSRCAAAIHSGWRSAELGIAHKAAALLCESYNAQYDRISACILPSISPDSYQVGPEVAERFPLSSIVREDGLYVDLWRAVTSSLVKAGLYENNIYNTGLCTKIHNDRFYSHRCGNPGRNLNFVVIRPL